MSKNNALRNRRIPALETIRTSMCAIDRTNSEDKNSRVTGQPVSGLRARCPETGFRASYKPIRAANPSIKRRLFCCRAKARFLLVSSTASEKRPTSA